MPKGRIYSLSIPEQRVMEEYVEKALKQNLITPSTSPAASSFFFVGKKDGGSAALYRLSDSKLLYQTLRLSPFSKPCCPGMPSLPCHHFHQIISD